MNLGKKWYLLLTALSCSFLVFCFSSASNKGPGDEYEIILKRVQEILSWRHLNPKEINDSFSIRVYDRYLTSLDPSKRFFLQSDMQSFEKEKQNLDTSFKNGDLSFYKSTIDTLYQRSNELSLVVKDLLKEPLNYTEQDSISFNEKEARYPRNKAEQKDLWEKYIKYSILQEIYTLSEEDENKNKSFAQLESMARSEVTDYMDDYFRRFSQRKKKDLLSVYINAFTSEYDPHTSYFSPKEKEDFDFNISGQLEGIGARLQDKKGYATILELIVGGPAWKSGQIEVGDQILKVSQGKNGKPVNVVGMLLDDAIRLIRGKKGSIVVLTVKKSDGTIVDIELERDVIEYNDAFARSAVIEGKDGKKYGIIYLPEFYANFNDKNGSDASNDVLREINALKKENIQGLIFDVRDNGGGSLQEAVEIAGFFINDGPVVQVQSSGKSKDVHEDKDKNIYWNGPMVIMVNELSASASEILAAALKDYDRAIVLGSKKTYGKGTVQSLYPLNSFFNNANDYGALKMTIQKFYRINGESTQLKGVESDIILPGKYSYAKISESDIENAMPWDEIEGLSYKKTTKLNRNKIIKNSKKRLSTNKYLPLLEENALWFKELDENKTISLRYDDFVKEMNKRKENNKRFENLDDYNNQYKFSSTSYEQELFKKDTILKAKRENWYNNLNKDFYLEEAIHVLDDM